MVKPPWLPFISTVETPSEFSLQFRAMTPLDLDEVHRLDTLSFSLPWPRRAFEYEINENPNARCWVAEMPHEGDRLLAGMLVAWVVLDEFHIATFAVLPYLRGQGIGAKLLAHSLIQAQKEGVQLVYLEVRRNNLAAQSLYEKFGFKAEGTRKGYYVDTGEDAILMTLHNLQACTFAGFSPPAQDKMR
jgi:[ribosomal protein S18]-alanine N-acetyltransferase